MFRKTQTGLLVAAATLVSAGVAVALTLLLSTVSPARLQANEITPTSEEHRHVRANALRERARGLAQSQLGFGLVHPGMANRYMDFLALSAQVARLGAMVDALLGQMKDTLPGYGKNPILPPGPTAVMPAAPPQSMLAAIYGPEGPSEATSNPAAGSGLQEIFQGDPQLFEAEAAAEVERQIREAEQRERRERRAAEARARHENANARRQESDERARRLLLRDDVAPAFTGSANRSTQVAIPPGLVDAVQRQEQDSLTSDASFTAVPDVGFQINQPGSLLAAMSCENGAIRPKPGEQPHKVVWEVMAKPVSPRIKTRPANGRGRYAVDGAEDMFEELRKSKSQKIGVPLTPAWWVKQIGYWAGDKITKAGKRIADREGNRLLELRIEQDRMKVELECVAIEVCLEGKWVDGGTKPVPGTIRETTLKPAVYTPPNHQDVYGHEVPRFAGKARNRFRGLYNALAAYKADPCAGKGAKKGGTTAGGGSGAKATTGGKSGGRNCQAILDEIRRVQKQLKAVNEEHIQAQVTVLTLENRLLKARIAWRDEKAALERELEAANKELKRARAHLDRLIANARNASNPDFGVTLKRAGARVDKAEAAVKNLKRQLEAMDAKYKAKISEIEGKISTAKVRVAKLKQRLDDLRKREEGLWQKYNDCLQGK